jgi:hypothetical protein
LPDVACRKLGGWDGADDVGCLFEQVVPGNPLDDVKLLVGTVASLLRGNALRQAAAKAVSFGNREAEKVAA